MWLLFVDKCEAYFRELISSSYYKIVTPPCLDLFICVTCRTFQIICTQLAPCCVSGLLHWSILTTGPIPVKQPWGIPQGCFTDIGPVVRMDKWITAITRSRWYNHNKKTNTKASNAYFVGHIVLFNMAKPIQQIISRWLPIETMSNIFAIPPTTFITEDVADY